MIVTIKQARSLNYCSRGLRAFCKKHNIAYIKFAKDGINSEVLLKTNDSMALKLVSLAEKEGLDNG